MSGEETPVEAQAEAPAKLVLKPLTKKEDLYERIKEILNHKVETRFAALANRIAKETKKEAPTLRQVFSTEDAHKLFLACYNGLFEILLSPNEAGVVEPTILGIPGGNGSLKLTTAAATTKRAPRTGEVIQVPKRWRMKYIPGKNVQEKLKALPAPPADAPAATS